MLCINGQPLTGRMTLRDPSGRPLRRESYLAGLRHGPSLQWDSRGQLQELRHYAVGREVIYYQNSSSTAPFGAG